LPALSSRPAEWASLDASCVAVADKARTYLATLDAHREEAERSRCFPVEIIPDLLECGFVRGSVPASDGGLGFTHLQVALLMEEAGRAWGSLRTTTNILTLVAEQLAFAGTDDQKQRFLLPLLNGERLGWFAMTEPTAGSDAAALSTKAEHRPDGSYELSGRKSYITNATLGDFGIVLATVDPALEARGVTAFLIERKWCSAEQLRISPRPSMSVRAVTCCDIELDRVPVPAENVIGELGHGLSIALRAVNGGRLNVSAGCVGLAQAALDASVEHAQTRVQFGRAIGGFQLIQQLIVEIAAKTFAGRQMYQAAARILDGGADARTECSMAKYYCSELANLAASTAVQVFGAAGLVEGNIAERLFRDARESTIPEGTTQMQILQIGRALLGVSALR
jgi:acyl-CoA dehydrogenase